MWGGRREGRKGREGEGKERRGKGMGDEIKEGGKRGREVVLSLRKTTFRHQMSGTGLCQLA